MKSLINILGAASCLAYHAAADDKGGDTKPSPTEAETAAAEAKAALDAARKAAADHNKKAAVKRGSPGGPFVKVRVIGRTPISEGGKAYFPRKINPENGAVEKEADVFDVTPKRYAHIQRHVELVEA